MIATAFLSASLALAFVGAGILFARRSTHWGFGLMAVADVVTAAVNAFCVPGGSWWALLPAVSLLVVIVGWIYVASVERAR